MSVFAEFEVEVLKLLAPSAIGSDVMAEIVSHAVLISVEHTDSGYFITVSHPKLPEEESVCAEPIVVGHADGIDCGFVLFLGHRRLVLECHAWGPIEVHQDFRTRRVSVNVRHDVLR